MHVHSPPVSGLRTVLRKLIKIVDWMLPWDTHLIERPSVEEEVDASFDKLWIMNVDEEPMDIQPQECSSGLPMVSSLYWF